MRTTDLDCLEITFLYPVVEHFFLLRIIMSAKLTKRRKLETFYTRSHYLKTKLGSQDPFTPNPKNTKRKSVYRREANVMKVWIWSLLQGNILKCGWDSDIQRENSKWRVRNVLIYCSLSIFKLFTLQTNRWCGFDLCNTISLTRIPSHIILYWYI